MAVAYSATAPGTIHGTDGTTGSSTITETFGAAPASTTVIVAWCVARNGSGPRVFTPNTGSWTSIERTDSTTVIAMESFWRLGDGSTTAFQFTSDSSSEDWGVSMIAITGGHTASPVGGKAENSSTTGTGVTVTLTPTHASSGTPSLVIGCWGNTGNHTWTADGSMTERWDFKTNTFSNISMAGGHDTSTITSTSNLTRTWTASGSGANVAQLIEIRGASGDATMTAVVATATAAAPAAVFSGGGTMSAAPATATGAAPPAVFAGIGTMAAVVATATGAAPPASFTGGAVMSAVVATATGAAPPASFTGSGGTDGTMGADAATATALAPPAVFTGGAVMSATPATATADAPPAVFTGMGGTVAFLAQVATATMQAVAATFLSFVGAPLEFVRARGSGSKTISTRAGGRSSTVKAGGRSDDTQSGGH